MSKATTTITATNTTSFSSTTQSNITSQTDQTTASPRAPNTSLPVTGVTSQEPCNSVSLETIGGIAGGCSAAVLLLVLMGALCFFLIRRRRSKDKPGPLDQGSCSCSPSAKEFRQENVQKANGESSHQQQATFQENDLMQPTYFNDCRLDKGSLNPNSHFSSVTQEVYPSPPYSQTQHAAIRSKKPEVLLVVDETPAPYTSLRATVNDLLNPYNSFEDFGDAPQTSGKTPTSRLHVSEPGSHNISTHLSGARPLSENITHSVDLTYSNSANDNADPNVYQNTHSVVPINVESYHGETKHKKEKKKRKEKAESEVKNYKSGPDHKPHLGEHQVRNAVSADERGIQGDPGDKNVYRNDRVYSNY